MASVLDFGHHEAQCNVEGFEEHKDAKITQALKATSAKAMLHAKQRAAPRTETSM